MKIVDNSKYFHCTGGGGGGVGGWLGNSKNHGQTNKNHRLHHQQLDSGNDDNRFIKFMQLLFKSASSDENCSFRITHSNFRKFFFLIRVPKKLFKKLF